MINNGPEKKDVNFSSTDLINYHNKFLVGVIGNFVNRTLKFKGISEIPEGNLDAEIKTLIEKAYVEVGEAIEALNFKDASEKAMKLVTIFAREESQVLKSKNDIIARAILDTMWISAPRD